MTPKRRRSFTPSILRELPAWCVSLAGRPPTPAKRVRLLGRLPKPTPRACARLQRKSSSRTSAAPNDLRPNEAAPMSQALFRGFVVAGMAVAILAMSPAQAHNAGVSTSRVAIHGRTIDVEINALGRDYETAAGGRIAD